MFQAITDETFSVEVLKSSKIVLVDFFASWCNPCRKLMNLLEELCKDFPDIHFVTIDVDTNPEVATTYGVRGVPTLMIFKKGEIVATRVGAQNKEDLMDWFNNSIA